jgi:hypothetical protein
MPLHDAARSGNLQRMAVLLVEGHVDVHAKDQDGGWTAVRARPRWGNSARQPRLGLRAPLRLHAAARAAHSVRAGSHVPRPVARARPAS